MTGPLHSADPRASIGEFLTDPGGPDAQGASQPVVTAWYRFGDGCLGIGCDDEPFLARFRDVYRECATGPPAPSDPHQHVCRVRRQGADRIHVAFRDNATPQPDPAGYLDPMLREWEYDREPAAPPEWRIYRSAKTPACVAYSRTEMVLDRRDRWQWIVANAALSRVLAGQPQYVFFHGAAIGVGGRGVLILGPSGSGKTSVALALAARGHGFLSDEIAGVRLASRELVPVRRSSFVRPGPAAAEVNRALDAVSGSGGSHRAARVGDLFPEAAPSPVAAGYLVHLRRFADATRLERFVPGHRHLPALNALACSMVADRPGGRIMQILSLVNRLQCYFLDSASPDSAADAIEGLVEE